jgi:hypothetical protein
MLKELKALLGKTTREDSVKKSVPKAKVIPSTPGNDYRAVSVARGVRCCSAANEIAGKRYLLREAPRLPLVKCTMPANCSCKFRKDSDRRDGERRLLGTSETSRWYTGAEKRKRGVRRSKKD